MPEPSGLSSRQFLAADADTVEAGRALAAAIGALPEPSLTVYLHGDLGAGKTTFVRGILRGLGHGGRVPSPTYTLVEPYELDALTVYHIDLYRLADAREVEQLGLSELPDPGVITLIEWPGRGGRFVPPPDVEIRLALAGSGRDLVLESRSAAGAGLLQGTDLKGFGTSPR